MRIEPISRSIVIITESKRTQFFCVWLGVVLAIGLLQALYFYFSSLKQGKETSFVYPFIGTMTWSVTGGILYFGVRRLARRHPLQRPRWLRRLPLYIGALLAFGISQTTLMWVLRSALYRLFRLGSYSHGIVPLSYLTEFAIQVMVFSVMVGILHAVNALNEARARELRTAHLESSLARAELRNLRLQLQPHFLFNALNTISSTMYRDVSAADEMLAQLAELLRTSLRTTKIDEVALNTELSTLECYLAIMRARFGERLRVEIEVAPETRSALVPSMILQPLVENAIRHGNAERIGGGRIVMRALTRANELVLEVEDDGPGVADSHDLPAKGTGLSVTAERLNLLYGDAHSFETKNRPESGFLVRIAVPLRKAE
jgi:two-component system LytT family sensor kinase